MIQHAIANTPPVAPDDDPEPQIDNPSPLLQELIHWADQEIDQEEALGGDARPPNPSSS